MRPLPVGNYRLYPRLRRPGRQPNHRVPTFRARSILTGKVRTEASTPRLHQKVNEVSIMRHIV